MVKGQTPKAPRLGIDFGRVISGGEGPGDTPFVNGTVDQVVGNPPIDGATFGVTKLVERFNGRVWIVSKAGPGMQRKTLAWLDHWGWWKLTGMEPWSVCFVLGREQKAPVAAKLKLTHFIDDRLDVFDGMIGHQKCYQFGVREAPDPIVPVLNWGQVLEKVHP